jgi:hypothetical protein
MLVANTLCWFSPDAAQISFKIHVQICTSLLLILVMLTLSDLREV